MEYKANKLYKGNATIIIPVNKKYNFQHDGNSKITDENGFPLNNIGKSPGIIDVVSTSGFWAIDYQDDEKTYQKADSTPVEVGITNPPDIMTRMRQMIASEMMHKYGADSDQVETLEEALDFDIDGDGEIGYTAAEIAAMPDDHLVELGLIKTPVPDELDSAPTDIKGETITAEEPPPAV